MDDELTKLLKQSVAKVAAMSPDERDAMVKQQIAGVVAAEMSWPKPKFHWENGAKVYESFEDFCNG